MAERINQTLVEAARAASHHAGLETTFWEDALRDAAFKYKIMFHSATGTSPHHLWYGTTPDISALFTFGQLGTAPNYAPKSKLAARADPVRYMYAHSLTDITVFNLRTSRYQRLRCIDFKPYKKAADPAHSTRCAFSAFSRHIPTTITTTTPPPRTYAQAKKYPDNHLWEAAHNKELDAIDNKKVVIWNTATPPTKPISLTMSYRYKRDDVGNITERKARCAVRGDKMIPYIH